MNLITLAKTKFNKERIKFWFRNDDIAEIVENVSFHAKTIKISRLIAIYTKIYR